MSKTNAVTAAKVAETEKAQGFYARAKEIADAATALRDEMKAATFEFANPVKITEEAERHLNGSVRQSREQRIAASKAAAAKA